MLFALVHCIQHTLTTKNHINKPPHRNLIQLSNRKPLLPHDLIPNTRLILHHLHHTHLPRTLIEPAILNLKLLRQHLPKMLPLKHIPITNIKRLILRVRINRSPNMLFRYQISVRTIRVILPRFLRPRKLKWHPFVFTNCRVNT
ncbi:hypothetical protein HanRHA438_Chr10g0458911 [Helianthus annuus]|nr:hypothetical protein HanRHA438_Chr10g0458911 [Helianthus annuus]